MNVGDELRKLGKELGPLPYPEDRAGTHWEDCYRAHHNCAIQKVDELEEELQRERERCRKMHRRAQQAEAAAPKWKELLEIVKQNKQGVTSFSRLLMASGLQQAKEENERLRAALTELVELCEDVEWMSLGYEVLEQAREAMEE